MKDERVTVGGAHLAVPQWGTSGPTVLALHPGVGDSRIWRWCAPVWADAGFRVVAYDRRGFGATQHFPEAHDDLDDLQAVLTATDARPTVVVGNSKGGGLAVDLALSTPDDVTALVLIAPSVTGYDYTHWPTAVAEAEQDDLVVAAEAAGDLDLVNELELRYWLDGVDQPAGRVRDAPRDLMIDMNGRALRAEPIGEAADRVPAWDRLWMIDVPVLVIVGEYDLPGIRGQCQEIADAVPTGRLEMIEGAAHCPSLDRPDQLNALVLDFLGAMTD